MTLNLDPYLETLSKAGRDVDKIVVEMLQGYQYTVYGFLYDTLRASSEQWTGATARTLFVDGPKQEGNYIYLELGAHTDQDPSAFYKEYGRPNQAAEPFLRPVLIYYRRGGLRGWMEAFFEKNGLSTA